MTSGQGGPTPRGGDGSGGSDRGWLSASAAHAGQAREGGDGAAAGPWQIASLAVDTMIALR